jgi:hypothetical protein
MGMPVFILANDYRFQSGVHLQRGERVVIPSLIPNNHMSSGRNDTNPITLDANEFSGHILITDQCHTDPKTSTAAALP